MSVQYATEDGTATAGDDYHPANGTLQFAAGSAAALSIEVSVTDDAVPEESEAFTVRLSNAQGAAIADATSTGTIHDNDPAGPGDDYGDTQDAAALVVPATVASAREPIAGHLETADDVDYFRVVVDAGATVHTSPAPPRRARWTRSQVPTPTARCRWKTTPKVTRELRSTTTGANRCSAPN